MTDLSAIPQVDAVLRDGSARALVATHGRRPVADAVREVLDDVRARARRGEPVPPVREVVARAARELDARRAGRLTEVVNATGVVLHTNLGRAPLSAAAREAMDATAGYCSLEYDLVAGRRGSRTAHVGRLAAEACGAEAATVVNNGAAALVLVLAALAAGRRAIVSRGELVEIGGSFRLPEVMSASGSVLHEVGTTNRTRLEDYARAIGDDTGVVLKVHRSNYRIVGFTTEPDERALAELCHERGVPFVHDTGSGLLRPTDLPAAEAEPSAAGSLEAGADLVVFSGDKLLGGPQAGIIAGRADLVERCARHPLARALRIDKFRRAALEVTLASHLRNDTPTDLPVWAMLVEEPARLETRATALAARIGEGAEARAVRSVTGGGSMPGGELASWAVALPGADPDDLAATLRGGDPPIVGRVDEGVLVFDLRTVPPDHDATIATAVRNALR